MSRRPRNSGGSPRTMQDLHEYINRPIPGNDEFNQSMENRLRDLRRAAEDAEIVARDREARNGPAENHIEQQVYQAVQEVWDDVRRIHSTDARIRTGVRDNLIGRTPPFHPTQDESSLIRAVSNRIRDRVMSEQNIPRQNVLRQDYLTRRRGQGWLSQFEEAARTPNARQTQRDEVGLHQYLIDDVLNSEALASVAGVTRVHDSITIDFETVPGVHTMKTYDRPPGYWKRKDNKFIAIHDMPDEYIQNCMKMIRKNHSRSRPVRDAYGHPDIDNNVKVHKGFYLSPLIFEVYQELAAELENRHPKEKFRRIRR